MHACYDRGYQLDDRNLQSHSDTNSEGRTCCLEQGGLEYPSFLPSQIEQYLTTSSPTMEKGTVMLYCACQEYPKLVFNSFDWWTKPSAYWFLFVPNKSCYLRHSNSACEISRWPHCVVAAGLKVDPAQILKPVNKMSMDVLRLELIRGIANSNTVGTQEAYFHSQHLTDELKLVFIDFHKLEVLLFMNHIL